MDLAEVRMLSMLFASLLSISSSIKSTLSFGSGMSSSLCLALLDLFRGTSEFLLHDFSFIKIMFQNASSIFHISIQANEVKNAPVFHEM